MKQITIINNASNPELPRVMASVSSNSFGDQIIEYKRLRVQKRIRLAGTRVDTSYLPITTVVESEGSWMDDHAIKRYYHSAIKGNFR